MQTIQLAIKNMVCPRCKNAVHQTLQPFAQKIVHLELGKVEIEPNTKFELHTIEELLKAQGFELLKQKEDQLIERVKTHLFLYLETFAYQKRKLSDFLAENISTSYINLSKLFSQKEGITIEKYFILLKIEKVKECVSYNELNINELADRFGYSSAQALSTQFKQITGKTLSEFKKEVIRHDLDKLY